MLLFSLKEWGGEKGGWGDGGLGGGGGGVNARVEDPDFFKPSMGDSQSTQMSTMSQHRDAWSHRQSSISTRFTHAQNKYLKIINNDFKKEEKDDEKEVDKEEKNEKVEKCFGPVP